MDKFLSVIFVSHRLQEVLDICDRYTILRDGNKIGTFKKRELSHIEVITNIVGREILDYYPKVITKVSEPILKIKNLSISHKDNTFKTKKITVYPFRNFTSVANDDALLKYIKSLPTGTARAYFLKGPDKSGLQKMVVPKVGDARLAVADENQIGMDWGTTGYRTMVPDLDKGAFPTTASLTTTPPATQRSDTGTFWDTGP